MPFRIIIITCLFCLCNVLHAETPLTLDDLIKQVKQQRIKDREKYAEREARFKQALDQQVALLEEANQQLQTVERHSERLQEKYDQNIEEIDLLSTSLGEKMGSLGELHGVVRQIAGDIDVILDTSVLAVEHPDRDEIFDQLAASKELPSISELERLWHNILDEMADQGEIKTFKARVISQSGEEIEQDVTRVGVFNVISKGKYLRHLTEAENLIEPGRQPADRYQRMALDLEQGSDDIIAFPVDPTRGAMLALLVQVPDFTARIQQGGIVGYIIIVLGVVGLLIAFERLFKLGMLDRQVRKQLSNETAEDNPLGRIMRVFQDNPGIDTETLEFKLDEAILKEMPALQRGLGTLSLLAGIAPLLGLLGTVVGIILTFQSITLYGTGDPRTMSGGISQALVTTVMGLVVAIPLLLLHSFITSKSNRLIHILDEKSAAFVAMLAEQHKKE